MEVTFGHPEYLWLFMVIPVIVIMHFYTLKYNRMRALKFANFEAIARVTGEEVLTKNVFLLIIRLFTISCLILAVAGTVLWYTGLSTSYDMVLAIDASGSMLAQDYSPNRLEAAKEASLLLADIVKANIRLGVVSFSGAALVEKKITDNIADIKTAITNIDVQKLSGTDIGQALVTSFNLFMEEDKPKAIVLLSDGQSNFGIEPADALEYIGPGVVVYTIGIGTVEGGSYEGVESALKLDETTLKFIAEKTGGKYYRAEDEKSLKDAFNEIASVKEQKIQKNLSPLLMIIAFSFFFIEWGLIGTRYKII